MQICPKKQSIAFLLHAAWRAVLSAAALTMIFSCFACHLEKAPKTIDPETEPGWSLWMDESFDGLDPMVRLTLKRELIKLVEAGEISVIISSHNIRELEDICDDMALLEKKQIVFTQSLDELRQNYHKVQLGYNQAPAAELFEKMPLLNYEINNKVVTVIYRGDEAKEQIELTGPVLFNPLPLSMEEIFVVEMEVSQNEN